MEIKKLIGLSKYGIRADGEIVSYWGLEPKLLKGGVDKDGYRKFVLIDDLGARRYVRRSSLVCTAFHGPRPRGKEVRHLDGSRCNDAADNLTWATHKENCADKRLHGTWQRGENANNVKATEAQARLVKKLFDSGANVNEVMAETKVTRSIAYNIKYGKSWQWLENASC